jgi:hypothetical protein
LGILLVQGESLSYPERAAIERSARDPLEDLASDVPNLQTVSRKVVEKRLLCLGKPAIVQARDERGHRLKAKNNNLPEPWIAIQPAIGCMLHVYEVSD